MFHNLEGPIFSPEMGSHGIYFVSCGMNSGSVDSLEVIILRLLLVLLSWLTFGHWLRQHSLCHLLQEGFTDHPSPT